MELDGALSALGGAPKSGGTNYAALRANAALPTGSGDIQYPPEAEAQIRSLVHGEGSALSGAIDALTPSKATAAQPKQQAPQPKPQPGSVEEPTMSPREMLETAARGPLAGPASLAVKYRQPLAEVGKNVTTAIGSSILGGLAGLYTLATSGGDTEKAKESVEKTQEKLTYQPKGEGAQKAVEALGSNLNPLNWIPHAANAVGDAGIKAGVITPGEATAISTAGTMVAPGAILKGLGRGATALKDIGKAGAAAGDTQFGSVGAAASSNASAARVAAESASPELKQAISKGIKGGDKVNPEALKRQVQADSLPVPMKLTEGQASGDINILSKEMNSRGSKPELANRLNEQNQQLKENMNAIRDEVAPDVFGTSHVENGQSLMDSYKQTFKVIDDDISVKYKALEDANGGHFPIDGVAFADAAEKALAKKLKTDFVPTPIAKQLEKFKAGEPMNFEQFEAMRTNLAAEMRKAERTGDGNAAIASGIVRQALEDLPLTGEAARLKPLADAARSAAKAKYDLLKKDPAAKAAYNDAVSADDFINKFVVNGKAKDVKAMVEHLGEGSQAHQTMSAGVINYLKQKAGIVNDNGNFSQSGYNKALQQLRPKLVDVVGGKATKHLENVGDVARWTQEQPRGSFVNNSNTFVAAAAEHAKGLAEGAANKVIGLGVVPVGTMVREAAAKRAATKATMQSLQTGAGIFLKDVKK